MENRTLYCSTKRFEGDDATRTALTLDFSNVTEQDLVEYAIDALVIKWQSSIRRKKDTAVPTVATYIVPKPGTRTVGEITPTQLVIKAFGADKAAALIEKHGSAEAVVELLKEMDI